MCMLACSPPPPEHPMISLPLKYIHHLLRNHLMSTPMTHLNGAGPLGLLAHKDGPSGWGLSLLVYSTTSDNTSDHNCCQTRNDNYDYFITTILGKATLENQCKVLLTNATSYGQWIFGPLATAPHLLFLGSLSSSS